jgi:hypothetical protein
MALTQNISDSKKKKKKKLATEKEWLDLCGDCSYIAIFSSSDEKSRLDIIQEIGRIFFKQYSDKSEKHKRQV